LERQECVSIPDTTSSPSGRERTEVRVPSPSFLYLLVTNQGLQVIRFCNDDVLNHLDDVIAEIDATLIEVMAFKEAQQ
jgi:hypothetical protein